MPSKRSIAPNRCKVLFEHVTPEAVAEHDPFGLPASFPAHALDEEQLAEVGEWWDDYLPDLLHALKRSLVSSASRYKNQDCPPTLQNLIIRAVVLAHLLRLHPAAEESLPKLATALKVPPSRLYYARDAILETLSKQAIAACKNQREERDSAIENLASHPKLDYLAGVRLSQRVLLIPFVGRLSSLDRFAVMKACAAMPAIASVREDSLDNGRRAIRITLKA